MFDKECDRCGAWMEIEEDYENGIRYYICRKCGNVKFMINGLGDLHEENNSKN